MSKPNIYAFEAAREINKRAFPDKSGQWHMIDPSSLKSTYHITQRIMKPFETYF